MRAVICILLLMVITTAEAGVYRWIAPDGTVMYTDRPMNGAVEVPIRAWQPPARLPYSAAPPFGWALSFAPAPPQYRKIRVRKPAPGAHVREEGEGLEVVVELWPDLKTIRGHLIQILLDGQPHGDAAPSKTRKLPDVERGQHTIAAQVVSKEGEVVIGSSSVPFFYRRPQGFMSAPYLYPSGRPVRAMPWSKPAPMAPRAPNVPSRPGSWGSHK